MNLSRREFTRLSALGLAAQLAPHLKAQPSDRKIGYAIIGLGRIADHFMRGIQDTPNSKVVALVSGHPDKASKIAEQYGVPKSSIYNYENMDTFRDNHAIDAVYVALPNSMHAEYTIRSAKAGKHVLCEKPMAVNPKEGEAMIAACNAAKVKLMIAYRCHYNTTHIAAICGEVHQRSPQSHIVLMAIFPRGPHPTDPLRAPIQMTNQLLAQHFSNDPQVTFLDIGSKFLAPDGSLPAALMPDGTHPSDAGYKLWANALLNAGIKP